MPLGRREEGGLPRKPEQSTLSLDFHQAFNSQFKGKIFNLPSGLISQSLEFSENKSEANTEATFCPLLPHPDKKVAKLFVHKNTKTKEKSALYLIIHMSFESQVSQSKLCPFP